MVATYVQEAVVQRKSAQRLWEVAEILLENARDEVDVGVVRPHRSRDPTESPRRHRRCLITKRVGPDVKYRPTCDASSKNH